MNWGSFFLRYSPIRTHFTHNFSSFPFYFIKFLLVLTKAKVYYSRTQLATSNSPCKQASCHLVLTFHLVFDTSWLGTSVFIETCQILHKLPLHNLHEGMCHTKNSLSNNSANSTYTYQRHISASANHSNESLTHLEHVILLAST